MLDVALNTSHLFLTWLPGWRTLSILHPSLPASTAATRVRDHRAWCDSWPCTSSLRSYRLTAASLWRSSRGSFNTQPCCCYRSRARVTTVLATASTHSHAAVIRTCRSRARVTKYVQLGDPQPVYFYTCHAFSCTCMYEHMA